MVMNSDSKVLKKRQLDAVAEPASPDEFAEVAKSLDTAVTNLAEAAKQLEGLSKDLDIKLAWNSCS
ncbi:hypothetical protein CBL_02349 [Carabus blaptoides fortunei]